MMPEWMPYANFMLNLLIIPLLKVLVDVKIELTRINSELHSHHARLETIERKHEREDIRKEKEK